MNRHPIVFVHGLLGWGSRKLAGIPYFGMAGLAVFLARLATLNARRPRALFPSVGPISSNHDRACELFYQLKGGDVHYGPAHAAEHLHAETIQGWAKGARPLFPQWDAAHPVHFVGQAQGASTVRLLQHLLAQRDFFVNRETGKPYPTSAGWIRSITTLSAVHNGTATAYIVGCSTNTGLIGRHSTAEYLVRSLLACAGDRSLPGFLQRRFFDLELGHWRDLSQFQRGKDNAAYDLSLHGAQDLAFIDDHPSTHYFSFITSKTKPLAGSNYQVPANGMNLAFRYIAEELGCFTGPLAGLKYPVEDFQPWWQNDGLVPVYSQDVPRWGKPRRVERPAPDGPFRPGIWNIMDTLDMDHMETVALPHFSLTLRDQRRQLRLYSRICRLAMSLD